LQSESYPFIKKVLFSVKNDGDVKKLPNLPKIIWNADIQGILRWGD